MTNNSKAKHLFAALCAAVVSASAFAGEYTLKTAPQSLADWKNGSFYVGGVAPTDANASEAVVTLPANMTAKVDDGSVAFVGGFSWIKPVEDTSILEIDIDSDATFSAQFAATATSGSHVGKLVKKGGGVLSLATGDAYAYYVSVDVAEGTLAMPIRSVRGSSYLWNVDIAGGATLRMSAGDGVRTDNWWNVLTGGGDVTNGIGSASQCNLYVGYGYETGEPAVFSGRLLGKIAWQSHGFEYLTGTESTINNGGFGIQSNSGGTIHGINGVKKLGMTGSPSSIGIQYQVTFSDWGGRLVYLGEGETSDKQFLLNDNQTARNNAAIFDAGAKGGLNLTGAFNVRNIGGVQRLHLTGSNTQECVIGGQFSSNGTTVAYITKKGAGTWRFAGDTSIDRGAIGGVAVEEGTLAFDSIDEVGFKSALGPGMVFTEDAMRASVATRTNVPYFFRVGAATTAGTLSYTGTNPGATSTRPMALGGDAVLHNNATNATGEGVGFFYNSGVYAINAGAKKLTLSGTNAAESVIGSISNGMGVVSVEKTGRGKWVLAGTNNTFTGGIDVKEGTLVLRGVAGKFSWFRWVIQKVNNGGREVNAPEFGMWDAEGNRVNYGLVRNALTQVDSCRMDDYSIPLLQPGEVGYGKRMSSIDTSSGTRMLESMFCDNSYGKYGWWMRDTSANATSMNPEDDSTWIPVVMRHPENAGAVVRYNFTVVSGSCKWAPTWWTMEGSVDGFNWYLLDTIYDNPVPTSEFRWVFGNGSYRNGYAATHTGGRPIVGYTNDVTVIYSQPVSVAAGAEVVADGLVALKSLSVDPDNAGTIKGFKLASNGTLLLTKKVREATVLPLSFEGMLAEDVQKIANWTLEVQNGVAHAKINITGDGEIKIVPVGFCVSFR